MAAPGAENDEDSLNWTAVSALYAALILGIVWMLYWGDYRNAAWLGLIGLGGGCTAYGRILRSHSRERAARWWGRVGAAFYLIFFVWAGAELLHTL